ncbi:hypothetical protein COCON_G00021230 [Conger conger]|uniref:Ig-like domain-containing protein n=1 Tax=Conger conger TaxID=82655 RepID=A0A9Q1I6A7_CONCO|nr:hypothetical protein COCON_G00021230 [Conger conger]
MGAIVAFAVLLGTLSYGHCVELTQPGSMVVAPGHSLTISCKVSGYSLTDSSYYTGWIRQSAGKALEWIGYMHGDLSCESRETLMCVSQSCPDCNCTRKHELSAPSSLGLSAMFGRHHVDLLPRTGGVTWRVGEGVMSGFWVRPDRLQHKLDAEASGECHGVDGNHTVIVLNSHCQTLW